MSLIAVPKLALVSRNDFGKGTLSGSPDSSANKMPIGEPITARNRAYDHRQHQHHAACAKQRHHEPAARRIVRKYRFQQQPSSLQHRAHSAKRGLSNPATGERLGACVGQSDAAAEHRAARLLLQMAAHRSRVRCWRFSACILSR